MDFNLANLMRLTILNEKNIDIDSFKYFLSKYLNLILMFEFFFLGGLFYFNGETDFAFIKFLFGFLSLLFFFYRHKMEKTNIYRKSLIILLAFYSFVAYFSSAENGFGFMWTFFVASLFVFLAGEKTKNKEQEQEKMGGGGAIYALVYVCLVLILGLYDVSYTQNQFINYLSFFTFYSGLLFFAFICTIINSAFIRLYNKIAYISTTDPLTALFNRRKIDEVLRDLIRRQSGISVVMLDIDDFKIINDKNGHQVGDKVLKEFAAILQDNVRSTDLVGRWGGEEFIIVFNNINEKEAYRCVQNIQNRIKKFEFSSIEKLTCSFGIGYSQKNTNLDKLILKADNALYRAKKEGKDRIVVAED